MAYDLVVRNGTVVDGSGLASYRADVGVEGGTITKIGRITSKGRSEVDAEGCVVTPGFIDGHTHFDAQVMWDALGSSSCWHGVTTVIMGNCGFTLAPVRRDETDLVVGNLERAEDMSPAALAAGLDWRWETFPEYLDAVDARPKVMNHAAQIGHSALRTWAMGKRAYEEAATEEDLVEMERALGEALDAGAIGFTTSRSMNHETSDDRPVASRLAEWSEVRRLVGVMGERGTGVFELAQEETSYSTDPEKVNDYHHRLRRLSIDTGVPITFGVGGRRQLPLLDQAAAEGARMFGQSHSRGITVLMSFRTRLPFDRLPSWRDLRALPLEDQRRQLLDPSVRERLVRAAHEEDYGRSIGAEARTPDYTIMRVLERPLPPNPTVAELAAARGVDPVEVIIDLALASNFEQFFMQPLSGKDPEELLEVMRHPRNVMTFSDSGAHVSQIIDSSIQTHLLGHWVRDRQAFTLEEGVRMLTLAPATAWGFADRGLIRQGFAADLNVFDPAQIGPEMPELVHDLPGGERRLVQRSRGIRATVVGGQVALENGEHTGAVPGRLLRGGR